jgi:hypothetical protein
VFKRSFDGGETWTEMQVLYSNSTKDDWAVIGNSAVVQDRNTGKILVPFCRNNLQVLLTESTDDGTHRALAQSEYSSCKRRFMVSSVQHHQRGASLVALGGHRSRVDGSHHHGSNRHRPARQCAA